MRVLPVEVVRFLIFLPAFGTYLPWDKKSEECDMGMQYFFDVCLRTSETILHGNKRTSYYAIIVILLHTISSIFYCLYIPWVGLRFTT